MKPAAWRAARDQPLDPVSREEGFRPFEPTEGAALTRPGRPARADPISRALHRSRRSTCRPDRARRARPVPGHPVRTRSLIAVHQRRLRDSREDQQVVVPTPVEHLRPAVRLVPALVARAPRLGAPAARGPATPALPSDEL